MIAFCERYRTALEARNDKALLALASPNYHDQDVDFATLEKTMTRLMAETDSIRYEIRYRAVRRENGHVLVDMSYAATYFVRGERKNVVDDNQLVLEPEGDSFRILSGM